MTDAETIIKAALDARTLDDALALEAAIQRSIGARNQRPLGDTWNNHGLMTSSGSFDHKALEPVTNMQDSVLERFAAAKFGDLKTVPYSSPGEAARKLLDGRTEREIADDVTVTLHEAIPPAGTTKRLTIAYRDHGCGMMPDMIGNTIFRLGSSHKTESLWYQGAFGLGGASTYRNAEAIVLVTL